MSAWAKPSQKQATDREPTLLTYSELSRLSPQRQVEYIEGVRELLVELSKIKDSKLSDSSLDLNRESRQNMIARLEQWLIQASALKPAQAANEYDDYETKVRGTLERCAPSSGNMYRLEYVSGVGFTCSNLQALQIELQNEQQRQWIGAYYRRRMTTHYRTMERMHREVGTGERSAEDYRHYREDFAKRFAEHQLPITVGGYRRVVEGRGRSYGDRVRQSVWQDVAAMDERDVNRIQSPRTDAQVAAPAPPVPLVPPRVVASALPPPPAAAPVASPSPSPSVAPAAAIPVTPVAPPQPPREVAPVPPPPSPSATPAPATTSPVAPSGPAAAVAPTDVNRPISEAERARRQRSWPAGIFGPFSGMEVQRGACGENARIAHHDEASGVWFCLTDEAQRKLQAGEIEIPQLRPDQLPVDRCAPVPMVCEAKEQIRRQFWGTQGVKCLIAGVVSELEAVPGRPDDKRCKVSGEVAVGEKRLRCGTHQSICNPLLFGSVNDQTPICMGRGHDVTARCSRVSTAHDAHRFLSRNTPGIQEAWDQLRTGLREVCEPNSVSGRFHCEECNVIRQRLFELNAKIVGRERACENADHLDRIRENLPLNATPRGASPRSPRTNR